MFWNKCLLYKGISKQEYNEIINILELNHIKYTDKVSNKNKDIGPIIDKIMVGTGGQKEDFSYKYSVFVSKDDFEYANSLIKANMS